MPRSVGVGGGIAFEVLGVVTGVRLQAFQNASRRLELVGILDEDRHGLAIESGQRTAALATDADDS